MDAPKEFELKRYISNRSKACAVEVDLENPKDLRELYNGYPLASDTIETKKKSCLIISQRLQIFIIFILLFFSI